MKEAGAELETLDTETPPRPATRREKPAPKTEPKSAPAEPKPEDPPKPPEEEPTPETEEVPSVEPAPEPERPMKAAELRKAYEDQKRQIKEEYQPKIAKLEARVKELETAKPEDPATTERFKGIEERNKALEAQMRLIDYSQSQEYQEKYQKPYVEAWDKCLADIAELEVEVPDGQGGYTTRKAKDIDVQAIAGLPLGERVKKCNAMFGDAAPIVMEHVQEIIRTNNAQQRGLADAKKAAEEWAKSNTVRMQQEQEGRLKLWTDTNQQLATRYPRWFAPVEGDTEGNKLLSSGFALTNLVFNQGKPPPEELALLPKSFREEFESSGKLSPQSTVRLHALIRNKAANHDRLARQLKAVSAELAAAKKTLAEYEDSAPPVGGARRAPATGANWQDDADAEIDQLDKVVR